jgi:hypothetical protein
VPLTLAAHQLRTSLGGFQRSRLVECLAADDVAATQKLLQIGAISLKQAAGVGFEPTVPREGHSGFQDRPVRPLRHPAVATAYPRV